MPRQASKALAKAFEKAKSNVTSSSSQGESTIGRSPSKAVGEVSYAQAANTPSDRYIPASFRTPRPSSLESPEIQECRKANSRLIAASKKNLFNESEQKMLEYDNEEKVMDYQNQRRRSIHSQISDMATGRTAITKVDAAKRSTAYNDMLWDVCGVLLERRGDLYFVVSVKHGTLASEGGVVNGHELIGVDFNKDSPEYGRAEGQEVKGLTLESICELIAGAPDLDPGLIGFQNDDDGEVQVKFAGTQLRFRAHPNHHQVSVSSEKMKEKIKLLRDTAKNVGTHEGLILRNCWTLFSDMNHTGSGQLTSEDLLQGLRDILRVKVNEAQASEMFAAADVSETGTISFQDFKDTVIQVISTDHFPERFTPWLPAKEALVRVLCAPDRRAEMDALRPWVVVAAAVHCLAVAALTGISLSRWKEEDKAKEQWDGIEQDEVRLLRSMFLIACLMIAFFSTVMSMRQSSPVGMSVAFLLNGAMSTYSVVLAVQTATIARARGERSGELVLGLVMVLTGSLLAAFMCMLLIRVSCFLWFRQKVNAEIRARMAREIPTRTRLSLANASL